MQTSTLQWSLSDRGVATITLNRPDRGNACDRLTLLALRDRLSALRSDRKARVLVLRGAGKHFCTGADIRELATADEAHDISFHAIIEAVDTFPKPTVAVVQGGAIGGGAGLAAACDITIADEQAFFSIPEVRVGAVPDAIAGAIIRAAGERNFRRYALSGERIGASEALRIGLAQLVVGEAERDRALAGLIDAFLLGAPEAQAETKRLAFDRSGPVLAAPDERAAAARKDALLAERAEGAAAYQEKRKPNWYA